MDNNTMGMLDTVLDALADRVCEKLARPTKELYTVQDLCERYSVSDDTIMRWIRAGDFGDTVNPTKRIHLVRWDAVQAFDEAHTGPAYTQGRTVRRRRAAPDPGRI